MVNFTEDLFVGWSKPQVLLTRYLKIVLKKMKILEYLGLDTLSPSLILMEKVRLFILISLFSFVINNDLVFRCC